MAPDCSTVYFANHLGDLYIKNQHLPAFLSPCGCSPVNFFSELLRWCWKQSHDKNLSHIKGKVLFQTEEVIRKPTGIPLGTIVFVMRKLNNSEAKGLGLGSLEMLFFSQGRDTDVYHSTCGNTVLSFLPWYASQCLSDVLLQCVLEKLWSRYPFQYVWKKSRYSCMN